MEDELTHSGIAIRIAILIITPTAIALLSYFIANSEGIKNSKNLYFNLNIGTFFLFFGIVFAMLLILALLYAFTVKKNIHG